MMHVRYKLREAKGLVVPRRPGLARAPTIRSEIDGTTLAFKVPRHTHRRSGMPQITPGRHYRLANMIFRANYGKASKVSDNWKTYAFFMRQWAFNGSWFSGTLAELRMHIDLAKPVKRKNMGFSLFHPRAFETIVADYLTNQYSMSTYELRGEHYGKPKFIAPVGWQPLQHLPVVTVRLEVVPDETLVKDLIQYHVFSPIANQVMTVFYFAPSQLRVGTQAELDKWVSRAPMRALMDEIIDSIRLELSPQARAEQAAALQGLSDTALISDFAPLQWPQRVRDEAQERLEEEAFQEEGLFG